MLQMLRTRPHLRMLVRLVGCLDRPGAPRRHVWDLVARWSWVDAGLELNDYQYSLHTAQAV